MMARFRLWVWGWLGITRLDNAIHADTVDILRCLADLRAVIVAQTALVRDDLGAILAEIHREARDSRAVTSACGVSTRDDLIASTDQLDERITRLASQVNHLCRERTGTTAPDAIRSRPPREFTHADRQ